MSSDVVLTAALRNNLLSLQNTQSLIDTTQLRLATGLKVNSALDSPSNFFAAQSLDNRASDLTRLLDGVGQSIRTIEAADNGITGLTNLVEQAQSIASSARDELAASTGEARLVGDVDLGSTATLIGLGGIADNDEFDIVTTDSSGTQITETIIIQTGDTAHSLTAKITDQFADARNGEIVASVTDEGFISISSTNGDSFRIVDGEVGDGDEVTNAGFTALGLGDYFEIESIGSGGAATRAAATIVAGNTLTSITLNENSGDTVEAGDVIAGGTFQDVDGNTVLSGFAAADTIAFDVNTDAGTTTATFTLTAETTFQDLVDTINQDSTVNESISANFNSDTGQLSFTSLADNVNTFGIRATSAGVATFDIGLGDPSGNLDPVTTEAAVVEERVFSFNSSTESLDGLADDYNRVREQIDSLVSDAQYRGVNLLGGDNLTTFFNEDNTSTLTTNGANFTADGLGLTEATFRSSGAIELSATQSRTALNEVRSFGSTLANNLSIIQTREDFTKSTINTLKAGADDLTVADQNEEGANLLALQTRQTLGVTSLSLASQSQQAVLRLF
ncbi:MAG: flagellin [Alphaproteobacteria bacterium]